MYHHIATDTDAGIAGCLTMFPLSYYKTSINNKHVYVLLFACTHSKKRQYMDSQQALKGILQILHTCFSLSLMVCRSAQMIGFF